VKREFEACLRCGILAAGFARVRCDGCAVEHLVPFPQRRGGRRQLLHERRVRGVTAPAEAAAPTSRTRLLLPAS
jgi:hypothetical protein